MLLVWNESLSNQMVAVELRRYLDQYVLDLRRSDG